MTQGLVNDNITIALNKPKQVFSDASLLVNHFLGGASCRHI